MPLLFSYGTLKEEAVQLATFGRLLRGQPDRYEPVGYKRISTKLASGKRAWVYADAG